MNITTKIQELGALRPNAAKRTVTNLHLTAVELTRFKALAKKCGLNFSALTRAALRTLEAQIEPRSQEEEGTE